MGADQYFYYDFTSETPLNDWEIVSREEHKLHLRARITLPSGDYIFLAPCPPDLNTAAHLVTLTVNGQRYPVKRTGAMYVHSNYARYGVDIRLRDGSNELLAEVCIGEAYDLQKLYFSLQQEESAPTPISTTRRIHEVPKVDYQRNCDTCCTDGWHEGVGCKKSPGRFGYTKGDGLLDYAMPALGIVDKKYLCGQPKYRKPYRWSYSLLPEGMPLHGSFEPRDVDIDQDDVEINHLSVRWAAKYGATDFSCTYSLASPAVLTERSDCAMRISGLRFAGNYQSVLIPRAEGIEETALDEVDIAGMAENWILLYNSTEFPDVPLMLVFEQNPTNMKVCRDDAGRLLYVDLDGCGLMLSCTPFGIERFERGQMSVADAIRRCRFWSRALLAYPVRCREYFLLDETAQQVTIRQQYEYCYIKDAWNTEPLELAPLPPPLSICGISECPDSVDFEFPTKYGWLRGRIGTWSEYTLPMMPIERKYPLRDEKSEIPGLIGQGMEAYKNVVSAFAPDKTSYPYAGSILEPFAMVSTMSLFMNDGDREFIRKQLTRRLKVALDSKAVSDYTVIDFGEMMRKEPVHDEVVRIYKDPAMKHMHLHNWYSRIEPFTGVSFKICYFNVNFFSTGVIKEATPEEILSLRVPLIENDWGVGLTFYYIYLSALATGSFEEIRKNWDLIKDVYAFFDMMHDWACMGTGYSDNGITWVEGANYGLFPSYIRMAEAAGDTDARDFGVYNAAKQLALRLAIMQASQIFFPRYFDVEPWYSCKFFHEEFGANMAFQNVPVLYEGNLRLDAAYGYTTEGMYPETYSAMRRFAEPRYAAVMERLEKALLGGSRSKFSRWGAIQQYSGLLIDKALNPKCPSEQVVDAIKAGVDKALVMRDWRGIHIFSRVLPENYLICQVLAWLEMRKHKLWLEHWEEMQIHSAVWTDGMARISFTYSGDGTMKLQCGVTELPKHVYLNGEEIPFTQIQQGKIRMHPQSGGVLETTF